MLNHGLSDILDFATRQITPHKAVCKQNSPRQNNPNKVAKKFEIKNTSEDLKCKKYLIHNECIIEKSDW